MELRQIESFFWIAVLGSFGAAANRLNTTQPAISSRILALEKELGVTLFDRAARQVKLTPKGMEIFDYAEKIIGLTGAIREATAGEGRVRGRVRLGVVNTVAHTWLPKLIAEVESQYPEIDVDFLVNVTAELKARLISHDSDLIIAVGKMSDPGLESQFLTRHSLDWIASPNLKLPKEPLSLADLAKFRIITYPKRSIPHSMLESLFKNAGIWPIRLSESNSVAAMVQIALSGVGICVIPSVVVKQQLAAGQLKIFKSEAPVPPLEFYATYLNNPFNDIPALIAKIAFEVCQKDALSDKRR